MELDWSEQSAHIRTLYAPWQPGDGYEEHLISAAEDRLGVCLPDPLRSFFLAWGRRKDLTRTNHPMLSPAELILQSDALIFWVENQGCTYWAIPLGDLAKANPPVVRAYPDWNLSGLASPLVWEPSHDHVSDFLDTLTYRHALDGGSLHGAGVDFFRHQEFQERWLEHHWHRATVGPTALGFEEEFDEELFLYVRPGQALAWHFICVAATSSAEALNEIAQALQITWEHQW